MTSEFSPFLAMAAKYRDAVGVILSEGKTSRPLRIGDEFKTTSRHTVVVATICDTLGRWIGLDDVSQEKLNITAILHDADKKLELRPDEFTEDEKLRLKQRIESFNPDKDLLAATKENFVTENKDRVDKLTLSQMIIYYADMIVSWSNIVDFRARLDESETRRPELPKEFFETELRFGTTIEQILFDKLPEAVRQNVKTPDQIPEYLRQTLSRPGLD